MNIVTIWNYLSDTKRLISQSNAIEGKLPAYCTTIEPPEIPEGKEAFFDEENQSWHLQNMTTTTPPASNIKVYGYMPDTLVYIGSADAMVDAMPANCTTVAPDAAPPAGYILTFDLQEQVWQETEDHRGETVYSTDTAQSVYITAIGPYPDGTTTIAPAVPFPVWNGDEWVTDTTVQANSNVRRNVAAYRELMQSVNLSLCPLNAAVAQNQTLTTDQQDTLSALRLFAVELAQFIQTADLTQSDLVFPEIEPALIAYPFVLNPAY